MSLKVLDVQRLKKTHEEDNLKLLNKTQREREMVVVIRKLISGENTAILVDRALGSRVDACVKRMRQRQCNSRRMETQLDVNSGIGWMIE